MPGPAVSEIHDRGLLRLKQAVGIDSRLQIVRFAGAVPEPDLSLRSVRKQLKEIIIRVVDDQRRRPGEPAVGPGIRQHVHRDPRSLRAVPLCQLHRAFDKISVRTADQAVFVPVQSGAAALFRLKIVWQEMEGGPDSRNILQPQEIRSRIRHLHGQLGCRRRPRGFEFHQQVSGAEIHKLCAGTEAHALLMAVSREDSRAVGRVIVKILLHLLTPAPPAACEAS